MSELPKGWASVTYDDVATYTDYVANGSFATLKENVHYKDEEDYAILVRLADETKKWRGPFKYVSKDAYDFLSKSSLVPGDLFLVNVGAPGKAFIVPDLNKPMTIAPNGVRVRVKDICINKYLYYYILSPDGQAGLNEITSGNAQQKFNKTLLKKVRVPLAPINEQNRIADKLDSILAKVNKAQERLEKIPGILKRFRQSVLAAATSGELTREWRGNKDANWETTVFGDLIKHGPQNGIYKPSTSYGSGTKIIRIDGFYDGKLSPWSTIKRVQLEESELSKWKLNVDDILINRVNSIEYLGKCGHVDALPEDAVFESNIMRVELDKSRAIPRFIKYFLSSPTGLSQLRANAKHAVNQASINQTDVKSVEIQLPSIEEQTILVNKVEALFLKADYFEKQYSDAKKFINRLGQSSLTKAFRGELVEQNDTDEPASQLLTRIKQQQLEAPKATRQTRKPAAKVSPSVDVVETDVELVPPESEILALLKKTSSELSAQQIMDKLTEKTFEQVDALFTELKRLLDTNSIVKVGSGEACTFKAIKR